MLKISFFSFVLSQSILVLKISVLSTLVLAKKIASLFFFKFLATLICLTPLYILEITVA